MLHEEEIALRRALHASLASKAADDEEPKQTKVKQSDKGGSSVDKSFSNPQKRRATSNAEPAQTNKTIRRSKRKSDEIVATGDRKRQKKLLVRIKPGKKKAGNISGPLKDVVDKKVVKSKALNGKKKTTVNENEGKIKRRRRRKKNVDAMQDDGNIKTSERYDLIDILLRPLGLNNNNNSQQLPEEVFYHENKALYFTSSMC